MNSEGLSGHVLLSRFYPHFIQILSKFYPDFTQIFKKLTLSKFYAYFWKNIDKIKIKLKKHFFQILSKFYPDF